MNGVFRDSIRVIAVGLTFALTFGCDNAGHDRVLGLDATGVVRGLVFFDWNGDRQFDAGDQTLEEVRINLVLQGTDDTVSSAATDGNGVFRLARVPVGLYNVVVDSPDVPSTGRVLNVDPTDITVTPVDSTNVRARVSFLTPLISSAKEFTPGAKVFVEGVALNALSSFGDSTVHVADVTGAIRAIRVGRADVLPGDSIRLLGALNRRDGQPTLDDVSVFLLDIVGEPPPKRVTTAVASTADGGSLDADLVEVLDVAIEDTATVGDDFLMSVSDGSGKLDIVLDGDAPFRTLDLYVPGVVLDVTGLLVPTFRAGWHLKPRSDDDLELTNSG